MNLALLTDRPHSNYGAELNLLALGDLCQAAGHRVTAVSIASGVFLEEAATRGFEPLLVPLPERLASITTGGLRATPATLARMAVFGAQLHQHLHRADMDVVVTSSTRAAAMMWPGRLRAPGLVWYAQMLTRPSGASAAAAAAAGHIALIAPGVERSIPQPLQWLRRRRTAVLPPWRDVAAYAVPGRTRRTTKTELSVVTVGKVTPRKGIRLLIDAAALAGDRGCSVTITVVGAPSGPADETYADEARRRAQELGVTVNWAGWQDDVAPFLSDADVFALVSDREGLPGAALEAMAAGLAVLVTDTGPIADLVRSTGSGVVVEQGDVSAVAARLVDLTTDPDATATMGQRGAYAAESFSPEATDAAFGAILNLMSPRSSRSFGAVR